MVDVRVLDYSHEIPDDGLVIDTTSRSADLAKFLSPFRIGPCLMYPPYYSVTMENAWQYCKVYLRHVDSAKQDPHEGYFSWARNGWSMERAVRYPMGKGAKPLYSYWNGYKLGYVEARKYIYLPLYLNAVHASGGLALLRRVCMNSGRLYLRTFDGYDHKLEKMSYMDVLNNPRRRMGHGFALAIALEEPGLLGTLATEGQRYSIPPTI